MPFCQLPFLSTYALHQIQLTAECTPPESANTFFQMGPDHCDPVPRRSVNPAQYGILLPNEVRTGTVELPSQDFLIKGHVNRHHHYTRGFIPAQPLDIGITDFLSDPRIPDDICGDACLTAGGG